MTHPTPQQIRQTRQNNHLTQNQAAKLIHETPGSWYRYETGLRTIHPAKWELFCLKLEKTNKKPAQN